ncbi:MAG TPA: hypothetical protein VE174_04215 [Actinomycetota bacterium]|nr:hypothetical protein [Actinomycetota bacterium]
MMKVLRMAAATAMVATMMVVGAGVANAEERRCTGTIGAKTLDNVKVPAGETCTLEGTTVKGTITVNRNARLYTIGARVVGNIQGENARLVEVRRGRVGGSIQVVQGGRGFVKNVSVDADILFDDQSRRVEIRSNTIGGNIQLFQSTGGVLVRDNVVDGNLQCKENSPAPTGGGNKVQGSKEDQCRGL